MDKRVIGIAVLSFVNVLNFAILIPVLPFVISQFGGGNITYGALISAYPVFQFLAAPALGTLSDHFGRRPILILSQVGTMFSWVVFGLAYFMPNTAIGPTTLPLIILMISRIVDGITGGNFSVANAYIVDITEPAKRTKLFGLLGATVGIGLIIGPLIGGFLVTHATGLLMVAIFSFLVSVVAISIMYFFIPETLSKKEREQKLEFHILREINILGKINKFEAPHVRKLFFIRGFFALAFSSYTSTIVLFMRDRFGLTPEKIGLLFLVLGSFFIFNQAVATPYLAKRFGDMRTYYYGQLFMVMGFISVSLSANLYIFIIAAYIINLGISSSLPTFKTIISNLVDSRRQGAITGVDESIIAGASAIAPLAASAVYTFSGQYAYALFSLILLVPFVAIYFRTGSVFIKH